jgi:hypothetical protein
MKYKLPDFDLSGFGKVWVGNRDRWATATAVNFVDDNLILVATFLEKKIRLIDISNGFEVIFEIGTKYYPDLMDYKDGIILTSERTSGEKFGSIGQYYLKFNKILYYQNIDFKDHKQIHGVRLSNNNAWFTETHDKRGIHSLNLEKSFNKFEYYPKDVYFIRQDRILVCSSNTRPQAGGKFTIGESYLYLFSYPDFKEIDKFKFKGQTDCICYENENGFITLQGSDSLQHFTLKDDKLENKGEIKKDFDFPHGCAIRNDTVCITNYGDNSLNVYNINELINNVMQETTI